MIAKAMKFGDKFDPPVKIGEIINNIPYNFTDSKRLRHKLLMQFPQAQFVVVGEGIARSSIVREKIKRILQ